MNELTHHRRRHFRQVRSVTVVAVAGAAALAGANLTAAAQEDTMRQETTAAAQLTVDLAQPQGEMLYGANGALYGLSDDGVPGDAALAPLKLTSTSQKPEGGLQHPNGDALTVSDSFFRNGGGDVYVLMQDIYTQWPYENLGLEDYLNKIDPMVSEIAAHPDSDRFVLVPFNEPDYIWYDGINADDQAEYEQALAHYLADWTTVYERIRSIAPDIRIAGPNTAGYDRRFLADYYAYALENDVLPDVTTWHELSAQSLANFQGNYDHYRALEEDLGFGPLPVNIDEYANRRDLSVPGQLVQWVGMFERNKVYANQAYWNAAGNLSGNVVQTSIPNGGWWFFRWYAAMTGQSVRVTPPRANAIDTLQGLASLDADRRQAQALVGGTDGDSDVVFRDVDPALFGDAVTVSVAEAEWSGYEGPHPAPQVLARGTVEVAEDGTVTVPLTDMDRMSAYRVVLTPAGAGAPDQPRVPWTATYEAEDAAITGGEVFTQGTVENANGYAASGTRDVGSLNEADARVAFTVDVPEDGDYTLDITYGNQTGEPSSQRLTVDGGAATTVDYPATLNWTHYGTASVPLELTAGRHTLTLAHDTGEATLDKIDLTAATDEPHTAYEATLADTTGDPAYDYTSSAGTGTGALVLDGGDDGAVFDVYAPRHGYYTLAPRHTGGDLMLAVHNAEVTAAPGETVRLLLTAGNNRVTATGRATLDALEVSGAGDTAGLAEYQDTEAVLTGEAVLEQSPHASGGSYIGRLGGSGTSAEFTVDAEQAGAHLLVVHYANDDRSESEHDYNTNIISRPADIRVNGGEAQQVMFRNTWSWGNFWSLAVPVELRAGSNTLTFANADGYAPNIDRVELAPVTG
ncbi:CBM35 domain-containing protein [Streptomyces sp. B6B3]|uniref:CBM35 domain-containing protein n=1 Tax=Streptomyces sp. B6B3 TaxID=3153570 RepID=UPI00325C6EF6